jgi:hypothetical protein
MRRYKIVFRKSIGKENVRIEEYIEAESTEEALQVSMEKAKKNGWMLRIIEEVPIAIHSGSISLEGDNI